MLSLLLALLPLAIAAPSLDNNLAYRSPYTSHPSLAIDTADLSARHLAARSNIDTVVAARRRKRAIVNRKRGVHEDNGEVRAPGGDPAENDLIYGLGVARWDHDWVFGGDVNFTHGVASGMLHVLEHDVGLGQVMEG